MKNTLFLIDDHPIIIDAIKGWIQNNSEWKVTGSVGSSEEALKKLSEFSKNELPEIVIFDIQLKEGQSFELIKTVLEKYPEVKAVVYSAYEITGYAMRAFECGAKGYVSKSVSAQEFFECLKTVQSGEVYVQKDLDNKVTKTVDAVKFLTNQERRIFEEIINGSSNADIAEKLGIGSHTTEVYVSRVYKKLGANYREDLVQKYK